LALTTEGCDQLVAEVGLTTPLDNLTQFPFSLVLPGGRGEVSGFGDLGCRLPEFIG
jgi:hypothetical protein